MKYMNAKTLERLLEERCSGFERLGSEEERQRGPLRAYMVYKMVFSGWRIPKAYVNKAIASFEDAGEFDVAARLAKRAGMAEKSRELYAKFIDSFPGCSSEAYMEEINCRAYYEARDLAGTINRMLRQHFVKDEFKIDLYPMFRNLTRQEGICGGNTRRIPDSEYISHAKDIIDEPLVERIAENLAERYKKRGWKVTLKAGVGEHIGRGRSSECWLAFKKEKSIGKK